MSERASSFSNLNALLQLNRARRQDLAPGVNRLRQGEAELIRDLEIAAQTQVFSLAGVSTRIPRPFGLDTDGFAWGNLAAAGLSTIGGIVSSGALEAIVEAEIPAITINSPFRPTTNIAPDTTVAYFAPVTAGSLSNSPDDPFCVIDLPLTDVQLAMIREKLDAIEKEQRRETRERYFSLLDADGQAMDLPEDPLHPAVIAETILEAALENGVNPSVVFALVNLQTEEQTHGLRIGKRLFYRSPFGRNPFVAEERKGMGLLTEPEFLQAIKLKVQDDIASGKVDPNIDRNIYAGWYRWGDLEPHPISKRYGVDDIAALVTLFKREESFTGLRESAFAIAAQISKAEPLVIGLEDGSSLVIHFPEEIPGLAENLVNRTILEAQAADRANNSTLHIANLKSTPTLLRAEPSSILSAYNRPLSVPESTWNQQAPRVIELLFKYFGPKADISWWINRIAKESTFNLEARNGSHRGLLQIDVDLHLQLILDTLKLENPEDFTPEMLYIPEINIKVAKAVFDEAVRFFGNGKQPWGG